MTITNTSSFVLYEGNGSATEFPFTFLIPEGTLVVSRTTGLTYSVVPTGEYSVSGLGNEDGGTVTFFVAPPEGTRILIERSVPYTQTTQINNQQRWFGNVITNALNRIVMQIQQVVAAQARTLRIRAIDSGAINTELPAPEANKVIVWNATGDGFVNSDVLTQAEAAAAAASNSANAAAATNVVLQETASEVFEIADNLPDWKGAWQTATVYELGDLVRESGSSYICTIAHTSGVFATDFAASRWAVFAEKGAPGAGTGDMLGANNLSDVDDAAVARTNLGLGSAALLDATAAGEALVEAANAAAQRTALGLGGLATQNILDEDDMASNSATRPPSQQSTREFVLGRTGTRVLAMCSFDGTSTNPISVAANALNVTNVTKNGTGDYTINFTSNLPHTNYAVSGMSVDPGSDLNSVVQYHSSSARAVGSVRVVNVRRDGAAIDSALITIFVVG